MDICNNDEGRFNTSVCVALPVITIFWLLVGVVGGIGACFLKTPHRSTISIAIVTTAVCCYTFWLLAFLAQLNPLVSPQVDSAIVGHMRKQWGGAPNNPYLEKCYPSW